MLVLVAISLLVFIGVCSTVGLRILWHARHTRGRAEWLCGVGFTSIGLVGYPASLASGQGVATVGEVHLAVFVVGTLFVNGGIAAFFAFTAQVFRSGSTWAWGLAATSALVLAAGAIGSAHALAVADPATSSFAVTASWNFVLQIASTVCFGWTALEAALQFRAASRRLALGLVEPLVVDRFRLWSIFGFSTMGLSSVFIAVQLAGQAPADSVVVHVSSGVLGTLSSVAVYLAFLPPRRYLARVAARYASAIQ